MLGWFRSSRTKSNYVLTAVVVFISSKRCKVPFCLTKKIWPDIHFFHPFLLASKLEHKPITFICTFSSFTCNTSMSTSSLPSAVKNDGYYPLFAVSSDLSLIENTVSVQQSPFSSTCESSSNKQISKKSLQLTRSLNSLKVPPNTSRGSPYISTLNGRRHIRPPASLSTLSRRDHKILEGSLYKQLLAKGVTEDVAYERQRIYNRLNSIVNNCNDLDVED